jgi:hypothetical protein
MAAQDWRGFGCGRASCGTDGGCQVLKITIIDSAAEQRLKVEGKVAEPWVSELESAWNHVQQDGRGRRIVVDLSNMTFIDTRGEAALMALINDGARLIAKGVYSEYVVKRLLKRAEKTQARSRTHVGSGRERSGPSRESNHGVQRSPMKEMH